MRCGVHRILIVVVALMTALATSTAIASALPTGSSDGSSGGSSDGPSFYRPPSGPLPKAGTLIRAQPMSTFLRVPSSSGPIPASATRIMYSSTDANGHLVAVTGYFLQPSKPWSGGGPRPIVAYAGGAHGQGDQCAPSRVLESITLAPPGGPMAEIESLVTFDMVAKGYSVVGTDYMGLGTPGVHTFGNRIDQANAVIDSARAVFGLKGVDPASKVALAGYSQGGGAVAGAAEQLPTYAPDLAGKVVGIYAGGIPANLRKLLDFLDGHRFGGMIALAINGLIARYPDMAREIPPLLNPFGEQVLRVTSGFCLVGVSAMGSPQSRFWTKSLRGVGYIVDTHPDVRKRLAEQTVGMSRPLAVPILLSSNPVDPTVPLAQGDELFRRWCAMTPSSLEYRRIDFPILGQTTFGHVAGGVAAFNEIFGWLKDRFDGKPAAVGCRNRPGVSNGLLAGTGSGSGSAGSSSGSSGSGSGATGSSGR